MGAKMQTDTLVTRFPVRAHAPSLGSRRSGKLAKEKVLSLLDGALMVEIDLEGQAITPGFADELVGGLWDELGDEIFMARVGVINMTEAARSLLLHIVRRRSAQHGG